MFEKIKAAASNFKRLMNGAFAQKIENLEFLFTLQFENGNGLCKRLERLENELKAFEAWQKGCADGWNRLEERIIHLEKAVAGPTVIFPGKTEDKKSYVISNLLDFSKRIDGRIKKLEEWAEIASDRFETLEKQRVFTVGQGECQVTKVVVNGVETNKPETIMYGSGRSGGKSFHIDMMKSYNELIGGKRKLIGKCKDCGFWIAPEPGVGYPPECSCPAIGPTADHVDDPARVECYVGGAECDFVFYPESDFGCIHWEKRDPA